MMLKDKNYALYLTFKAKDSIKLKNKIVKK